MDARTGSVELQDGFEAGAAWARCPKAMAHTSQVMIVERRNISSEVIKECGKRMDSQDIDLRMVESALAALLSRNQYQAPLYI